MADQDWKLPLLNNYIEKWAAKDPGRVAMIQVEDGREIPYGEFLFNVDLFALRLLDMGIKKDDRVATMLLNFPEHVYLMYACFKIGAIIATLDVRLQEKEVVRDLDKIKPRAFFFLGSTPIRDFRTVGRAVQNQCPYVEHLVQFTPSPGPGDILEGAVSITELMDGKKLMALKEKNTATGDLEKAYATLDTRTPALIIYTTGTTGEPKPAVLCHENIIVQNEILSRGIGLGEQDFRIVVNLPPSHVGCVTEALMTTFYTGGTALMLRIFDARLTLEAVQKYRATCLGQIPTQFRMQWAMPDFKDFDLSSLKFSLYGGSSVDTSFLNELAGLAPAFGTGMGMTETAGFTTFTPPGISVEEMAGQVGRFFPELACITIRGPKNDDGSAGDELPDGEIGMICYHPPIVFLGYYNQPEATSKVITSEGILYSGDLGYFKNMGSYRALYLSGRDKFVIKQKGFNVFPDEVQAFIAEHPKVDLVDVVGVTHRVIDEGIFAFVRPKKGMSLTAQEIMDHCQGIASYKRPQHVEIWPEDKPFPLTRVAKVHKMELRQLAGSIVDDLRAAGKWDAGR